MRNVKAHFLHSKQNFTSFIRIFNLKILPWRILKTALDAEGFKPYSKNLSNICKANFSISSLGFSFRNNQKHEKGTF